MNTKQVLYNALKGQLDAKEKAYTTFQETITNPAHEQLANKTKQFISTFANIDGWVFSLSEYKIMFRGDNHYSNEIHFELNNRWDKSKQWVSLEWNSGEFDLKEKTNKLNYIDLVHTLAHNLHYVERKWIDEWFIEYTNIEEKDNVVKKEWTNLRDALQKLEVEINNDFANEMKQSGFELKKFKSDYRLDWDYDDKHNRVYKIDVSGHLIKLQYGRSQYESTWIQGFKVLGRKGNKYNVEVYRKETPPKTFNVLEKKFDAFIEQVADWENKQADKRKADAEKRFADNTK